MHPSTPSAVPTPLGLPASIARQGPSIGDAGLRRCLETLLLVLSGYRAGALPQVVDLRAFGPEVQRLVQETLGVGEVSATVGGPRPAIIEETRLAGVWRVREAPVGRRPGRDVLEVAALPAQLQARAFQDAAERVAVPAEVPDGVMNAPAILAELNALAAAWAADETASPTVINQTLLPLGTQDLALLEQRLGSGPVRLVSRGYGQCQIQSTGLRGVWWVRYFNTEGRLILHSLEVTDCPSAALATQQDLEDSAVRLAEMLAALGPDA